MTDYQEIQERGHVSTLEYLKRAQQFLDDCYQDWRHPKVRRLAEVPAVLAVSGNSYTKVLAAVREHGGIDAAIAAIEAKAEK